MSHPYVIEAARRLAAEGLPRSAIAKHLHLTPSAVHGMLWRAGKKTSGEKPRPRPNRHRVVNTTRAATTSPSIETAIRDLPVEHLATAVPLIALDKHICHWPVSGTGIDALFCGDRVTVGSYCPHHHARSVAID
jgi:hypothetical protein